MSGNPPQLHHSYIRSEVLGKEITELFGYITAATYDLLVKIREFDAVRPRSSFVLFADRGVTFSALHTDKLFH